MTVPKYHHVSQNTPSVTSHILQHSLQNSLLLHNFMNPKMFLLAHFVTGSNDHPIPLIANFRLIMSHKLSRKPHALVILGVNLESIHFDINRLLHLGRNDFSKECPAGSGGPILGWGMDEGGEA